MSRSCVLVLLCAAGVFLSASAPASASPPAAVASKDDNPALLVLGPLHLVPALDPDPASTLDVAFVPELDPALQWPSEGTQVAWFAGATATWRAAAGPDGNLVGGKDKVSYAMTYLTVDRHGSVAGSVTAPGDVRVYLDGEEAAQGTTTVSFQRTLRRGLHRLLVRVAGGEEGPLTLEWSGAVPFLGKSPVHGPADYDELRQVAGMSGMALSPDGQILAYQHRGPDPRTGATVSLLNVVDLPDADPIVTGLLGDGASAVAWRRDGTELLVRRGSSLFVWSRVDRGVREVLHDEPGLGAVSWSPDGRTLVFLSTRGAPTAAGGNVRRTELREKLSDWPVQPHLHHLVLASGARQRLALPGDHVQDAFQILQDGRTLAYLRSLPRDARPWFHSEVHLRDLVTGEDRLVTTLVMGFENRPGLSGMAVSPDDRWMAFVGPPSELGRPGGPEPNAFDPDLFVVDLTNGALHKVSEGLDASLDGHLAWRIDSKYLYFQGTDGSRTGLFQASRNDQGAWRVEVHPRWDPALEHLHDVSFDRNGQLACVASTTHSLPRAWASDPATGAPRLLLDPNAALEARWDLPVPVDATVERDGVALESWLYRPTLSPQGPVPLIVYYYGGATPTQRGFNELHQFLVANGYALLVINPRGAAGYGQAFADHHAGDWGEVAGADILHVVEETLKANPDLDGSKVGCYGGSFGGFMTMYLLTRTDRFAAAVSLYGISNLASYYGDGMWGWTYGDQAMAGRHPWTHKDWYVDQSPLYMADRIHTPLLLLHGDEDGNVPPNESEQMFTALRLLGRPVELVRFPGEDHGLRGTWQNRVAHRTMLLDWFDRCLRDQPAAWDARW